MAEIGKCLLEKPVVGIANREFNIQCHSCADGRRAREEKEMKKSEIELSNGESRIKTVYALFLSKALVAGLLIMFVCMASGELLYDSHLFSGFLTRPKLWIGIFFETTVAVTLMGIVASPVLYRFRFSTRRHFIVVSTLTWIALGCALVGLNSHFYWTREWHLTAIAPGLFFGWFLPGLLTVICFVWLSTGLRQSRRE